MEDMKREAVRAEVAAQKRMRAERELRQRFPVGACVLVEPLRSCEPVMMVEGYYNGEVQCVWFSLQHVLQRAVFSPDLLVETSP